ncbi:hypothetical protein CS542_00820 [Pedobacter sp. IW39]|nr:hypothetical protein CS542_00820 [Pedobacter sp. IW39]
MYITVYHIQQVIAALRKIYCQQKVNCISMRMLQNADAVQSVHERSFLTTITGLKVYIFVCVKLIWC